MALTASFGSCDLFHALLCEKNYYRGRTAAKQYRFWKTVVKNAIFIFGPKRGVKKNGMLLSKKIPLFLWSK